MNMDRPLHIAYVCSDRGVPIGGTKGASVHVRAVSQALARRGHRVSIVATHPGPDVGDAFLPQIVPSGHHSALKRLRERMIARGVGREAARETYAILLGLVLVERLEALDREEKIDALYERHSLWSWGALEFAASRAIPHVVECNAPLVAEQQRYRRLELLEIARVLEHDLLRRASGVVVPSRALERHAARLGARPETIRCLPNAVDPELFRHPARPEAPQLEGRFVVAFAGSLKPWHGVEILLESFRELAKARPETHLLVIGDGPLGGGVADLARELGSDRITLTGAIDHSEVAGWLAFADVGVAPYPPLEDFYFSPMKVVEYQAAGLAVVASDLGHLRAQIVHGETGRLVPPGDISALTAELVELASAPLEVQRLGSQARRLALAECTWDRVAGRIEELLRDRDTPGLVAAGG